MEREDQGRASEHIGVGWSENSKESQRIAELVDKRKVIRLDQIGSDKSKQIGLESVLFQGGVVCTFGIYLR